MYLTTFSKWNSNKTRETVGNADACVDSFLRAEGVVLLIYNSRICSNFTIIGVSYESYRISQKTIGMDKK